MPTDMSKTYWNVMHDSEGCAVLYVTVNEALPLDLSQPNGRCAVALKLDRAMAETLRGALTGNARGAFEYYPGTRKP